MVKGKRGAFYDDDDFDDGYDDDDYYEEDDEPLPVKQPAKVGDALHTARAEMTMWPHV